MRYESEGDVKLRLQQSVVRFEGTPVYVVAVGSKDVVIVHNLVSGRKSTANVKDLDLSPVPLGYVESDGEVLYVTRKPTRRYKQGLTTENMVVREVFTKRLTRLPVNDKGLCRTILGNYPSIEDAFQGCREGADIIPFSREWAVANHQQELCILYRGDVVGYVGDDNVVLSPDKYYLKESLMEVLK